MSRNRSESPDPRRWAMFSVLLVGAFLPPLDFFIVNVALPSIRAELTASSSAEQLVISSYAGLYAVTLITGGRLGDLFGRGRVFFLGLIGFAAASTLCGLANSPWTLIAGRALQGVTAAIMAPQALASIQAIFPESEKPLALSLYGAVFGLAAVIGQALGGILISLDLLNLGWRTIFLVNLPLAILVVVFGIPLLKETRAQHARKLDLGGTALSMLTLGALIVPLIEGREAGWPVWAWVSLIAVPALAGLFWRYERRLGSRGGAPLLDPAALRAPGLGQALLIALLLYSIGAFFLLFSVYLQNALHVDALSAGLVFLPFGVGFLLGPLSTPFFSRFIGAYVNPLGMALEVVGLVGLVWLIEATPTGTPLASAPLAAVLFVTGFGQGLALPTLMRMVTGRVAPALSGMIAGIASSTLQVSTSLSVAIIGGIFYTVLGARQDPASIAHAFIVALLSISLFLTVGAALSISLARASAGPLPMRAAARSGLCAERKRP
ncbi:MFS transporter [bacterium M00.F.Ca.ET.228.01.1.1]|uniref:MFS transporter n=1 Tax=Paraburkholderia phenoliruptrix TaxID=252970 RepID=UPI0010923560|nr:MFS transporter [Paraburkholderia phenoliruptrix]TGP41449.1 MFS transporter [bacterium M00.F.Ca.ET.228.01.1.1]TGR98106.1 MFS transporter [bacterium M00.F.Ca.ET.191.01.1.1]TGU02297.1 MFS transporter [bacterium M00.F.Ca.ET.155.01.1.1]MBW0447090.1 MFS transporter [Paraburkholderia phenoliruptrix]MBW9101054.1 MFS transporter [Paraburkholderia phenoliruptrix]